MRSVQFYLLKIGITKKSEQRKCSDLNVNHCSVLIVNQQEDYPYELVKARFLKLNYSHAEYVIDRITKNLGKISNIKSYIITSLYNAPTTMNLFIQQEVQHDMYGGGWNEKGVI